MKLGILWVILLILLIGTYIYVADFNPKDNNLLLLEKINQLELKIDSLSNKKDSIRSVIDSTHIKIITNEKHYQERINTIMVQSSSADSSFITNYIRLNRSKRDSTNIY